MPYPLPDPALPSPPFYLVEGIHNFRDIGHLPISGSTSLKVRPGFVFRSADPSRVTSAGQAALRSLGITTLFDLRSTREVCRNAAPEIDGVTREHTPVFGDADYSPERIAVRYQNYARKGTEGFTRAYADILLAAPPSYGQVFQHLRDKPDQPCLVHCTAGKDRTGVLCALILSLAGVGDSVIADEYALTEQGLAELRPGFVERLAKEPTFGGDVEGAMNMVTARAENMLATLAMINDVYGGAEGYLRDKCGLTAGDLEKIRENLVVQVASKSRVLASHGN